MDESGQCWAQDPDVQEAWDMIEQAEKEEVEYDYVRDESVGNYYDKVLDKMSSDRSPEFKKKLRSLKDYYHRYSDSSAVCSLRLLLERKKYLLLRFP